MKTVALVGYGYWGPNLLRNYMELPGARVKWVCDSRSEALFKAQTRYPAIQGTTEFGDVLADPEVDAVVIATPISTHFQLAKDALLAGKHVFVEKPMTSTAATAAELVSQAEASGLTLMVGHTFVFSPPVRKVKDVIDSGELGKILFVTSSRVNLGLHQRDVSVIWDLAPHDLSILHYWLGETPSTVSVAGRACINPGIPDVAFINLALPLRHPGRVAGFVAVAGQVASHGHRWEQEDAALRRHRECGESQDLRPRCGFQGPGDVRGIPAVVPHG